MATDRKHSVPTCDTSGDTFNIHMVVGAREMPEWKEIMNHVKSFITAQKQPIENDDSLPSATVRPIIHSITKTNVLTVLLTTSSGDTNRDLVSRDRSIRTRGG